MVTTFATPPIIAKLIDSLRSEFGGIAVEVHEALPRQISPNRVVIAPAEPWLTPSTHNEMTEHWDVLAVANATAPDRGVTQLREMSVRILRAVHRVGAVWERSSTPMVPEEATGPQTATFVVNGIRFRWYPEFTDPDPDPDPDTGEPTP